MTTPLRQRMIENMQLRGLPEKTQESYVLAVRQLAEYSLLQHGIWRTLGPTGLFERTGMYVWRRHTA